MVKKVDEMLQISINQPFTEMAKADKKGRNEGKQGKLTSNINFLTSSKVTKV